MSTQLWDSKLKQNKIDLKKFESIKKSNNFLSQNLKQQRFLGKRIEEWNPFDKKNEDYIFILICFILGCFALASRLSSIF